MRVVVVPPDPDWPARCAAEADALCRALGEVLVRVHPIGSTSVPGLWAKPILDLLAEVTDVAALDVPCPALRALGYEGLGEFGIPGRRYFRKHDAAGVRTHQVHAFRAGDPHVARHMAFRDYLIAHPEAARAYGELKRQLAAAHPDDIEAYMDGKDPFIREHQARALAWWTARGGA